MFKVPSIFDQFLSSVTTISMAIGAVPVTLSGFTNRMLAKTGGVASRLSNAMAGEVGCTTEMAVAIRMVGVKTDVKNFLPKKNDKIISLNQEWDDVSIGLQRHSKMDHYPK